jgi:predicted PurR-regulated permease PerM
MAHSNDSPDATFLISLLTIIAVVATLYFAREVLVPLAFAILLTFVLSPLADALEKHRIGRLPSVLIVAALLVCSVAAIGWVAGQEMLGVAAKLPDYRENVEAKINTLRGVKGGRLAGAIKGIQEIMQEVLPSNPQTLNPQTGRRGALPHEQPVIVEPKSNPFSLLTSVLGPILGPIGTIFLVILFSIFMLLNRESLRNRVFRLAGQGHVSTTTRAMDEAADRVSRYLLWQATVNGAYAGVSVVGLYFIGVPNALIWGILAGLSRYAPFVGPLIGDGIPILLSIAVFSGWTRPALVLLLFVVLEIITAYFVEPHLYGSKTGITSLAVLVSAIFWTVLWGPIGLLLATPMTVSLVTFGKYVSELEFLHIVFSDEPVLPPDLEIYQRLLAADAMEAREIAEAYLQDHSLSELFDGVLISVLINAERDYQREDVSETVFGFITRNVREMITELAERPQHPIAPLATRGRGERIPGREAMTAPARDEADELVGLMLGRLAPRLRFRAGTLAAEDTDEMLERLWERKPSVLCISALPPGSLNQARSLYRQVKRREPKLRVVVGLWKFTGTREFAEERIGVGEGDAVVTGLADALAEMDEEEMGEGRQVG